MSKYVRPRQATAPTSVPKFKVGQRVVFRDGGVVDMPKGARIASIGNKNNRTAYDLDIGVTAYEDQLQG